jgi:hypothetical protein
MEKLSDLEGNEGGKLSTCIEPDADMGTVDMPMGSTKSQPQLLHAASIKSRK